MLPVLPVLACPLCAGAVPGCGHDWPVEQGVTDLFVDFVEAGHTGVTARVRAFYEERPFPDWRPEDDRGSLLRLGRSNPFTRWLDDVVPERASVLELGCGTGQMSLFLGVAGRRVLGVDLSMASLATAEAFRARVDLPSVRLVRGNLFRPPVAEGSADVGISSGVLHHTADPRAGLDALVRCVRPGGLVVVGFYSVTGRILLPFLRSAHARDTTRRGQAWFHDQHNHPQESRHSVDTILGWLDAAGVDFVRAFPEISFSGADVRGALWEHWLHQLSWVSRAADGGLFVLAGRKRGA